MDHQPHTRNTAFTLIELLIVVAIIAILAAIAVPNYLESQTRSKIARVRADMRTLAGALEIYRADANAYPQAEINGTLKYLPQLTTPIAYLSRCDYKDPFTREGRIVITSIQEIPTLRYYGFNGQGILNTYDGSAAGSAGRLYSPRGLHEDARIAWYALFSHGPDRVRNNLRIGSGTGTFLAQENLLNSNRFIHFIYDATNGTISAGEILRSGGSPDGPTGAAARMMRP